jgi:hypothetical protein
MAHLVAADDVTDDGARRRHELLRVGSRPLDVRSPDAAQAPHDEQPARERQRQQGHEQAARDAARVARDAAARVDVERESPRARWGGFTPNHLKFFSPSTLCRLLQLAGFGAVVLRPMLPDHVVAGNARLTSGQRRRMSHNVERRNEANMLRAAAFVDPRGPARWGMRDLAARAPWPGR